MCRNQPSGAEDGGFGRRHDCFPPGEQPGKTTVHALARNRHSVLQHHLLKQTLLQEQLRGWQDGPTAGAGGEGWRRNFPAGRNSRVRPNSPSHRGVTADLLGNRTFLTHHMDADMHRGARHPRYVETQLQGEPVTHGFPPKNCTVLRDTLIVLVRKGHGQEEGALLRVVSNVILMDWRRSRFRTANVHVVLPVPGDVGPSGGTRPFALCQGPVTPDAA